MYFSLNPTQFALANSTPKYINDCLKSTIRSGTENLFIAKQLKTGASLRKKVEAGK